MPTLFFFAGMGTIMFFIGVFSFAAGCAVAPGGPRRWIWLRPPGVFAVALGLVALYWIACVLGMVRSYSSPTQIFVREFGFDMPQEISESLDFCATGWPNDNLDADFAFTASPELIEKITTKSRWFRGTSASTDPNAPFANDQFLRHHCPNPTRRFRVNSNTESAAALWIDDRTGCVAFSASG